MKRIFIIALAAFAIASCKNVESTPEYLALTGRIDSLNRVNAELTKNYNETLDILGEIETGFNEISEAQHSIVALNVEGQPLSKKDEMLSQVNTLKDKLASQQNKINDLEKRLNQSNSKNKALAQTIERLQNELDRKSEAIALLEATIASKNAEIEKMAGTINAMADTITGLEHTSAVQQMKIATQDTDLNTVYYISGTEKELIANGFMEKSGLSAAKLASVIDPAQLIKGDKRKISSVALGGHRAKLFTIHPAGSFIITADEDGNETLEITDYKKFWSISNYLIVRVR
ncbi:MAG: hypothetical protein HUJ91_01380 [Bacteroidales bacterium]|nr:hypothetical protein [Bacteroidales bacterium]